MNNTPVYVPRDPREQMNTYRTILQDIGKNIVDMTSAESFQALCDFKFQVEMNGDFDLVFIQPGHPNDFTGLTEPICENIMSLKDESSYSYPALKMIQWLYDKGLISLIYKNKKIRELLGNDLKGLGAGQLDSKHFEPQGLQDMAKSIEIVESSELSLSEDEKRTLNQKKQQLKHKSDVYVSRITAQLDAMRSKKGFRTDFFSQMDQHIASYRQLTQDLASNSFVGLSEILKEIHVNQEKK